MDVPDEPGVRRMGTGMATCRPRRHQRLSDRQRSALRVPSGAMRLSTRNVGSNYLLYAASILSGLVLTPIIIDALGKEGYGVWVFIGSVTIVLRLLDFGITPTVVRFTAFHRGRKAPDDINALASTSLAVFVLLGAVLHRRRPRDRLVPAGDDRSAGGSRTARPGRRGHRDAHSWPPGTARALHQPPEGCTAVRRHQRRRGRVDRRLRRARNRRPAAPQHTPGARLARVHRGAGPALHPAVLHSPRAPAASG